MVIRCHNETKGNAAPYMHVAHSRLQLCGHGKLSALTLIAVLGLLAAVAYTQFTTTQAAAAPPGPEIKRPSLGLRAPESFASLREPKARSLALIGEAGKVIQHARCVNCHPVGDAPLQGRGEAHLPGAVRGADGFGAVAMRCPTCHQAENYEPSGVPGHPKWRLAPREMAWQGKSLGKICTQIKDPRRNGGLDLSALQHHMAEDTLVGWAWNPGHGREPAPGTQQTFGALIAAWIASGAECPAE